MSNQICVNAYVDSDDVLSEVENTDLLKELKSRLKHKNISDKDMREVFRDGLPVPEKLPQIEVQTLADESKYKLFAENFNRITEQQLEHFIASI